jgi:hypothetical protein
MLVSACCRSCTLHSNKLGYYGWSFAITMISLFRNVSSTSRLLHTPVTIEHKNIKWATHSHKAPWSTNADQRIRIDSSTQEYITDTPQSPTQHKAPGWKEPDRRIRSTQSRKHNMLSNKLADIFTVPNTTMNICRLASEELTISITWMNGTTSINTLTE